MAYDTYIVFAAEYPSLDDARSDYEMIKDLASDKDMIDTFDSALIERKENGKVRIVDRHEGSTRDGGKEGAGIGLAGGVVAALFPAVGLGAGLLAGALGGGAIGAIAGHVQNGMSRGDLKDIGEYLDNGEAGILCVCATDMEKRIEQVLSRTTKVMQHELRADEKELEKEISAALKSDTSTR